jgi:dihydroorotase
MPNLLPSHIRNAEEVLAYRNSLNQDIPETDYVEKILTISLKPETTPETIAECAKIPEFKAVKYYPGGVTTNSGGSTGDIDPDNTQVKAVFEKMAELGIILSLHPETTEKKNIFGHITGGFVHNAEREFITIAERIAHNHSHLKIVIEHISTAEMAKLVGSGKYPNIYGSVTPQHLIYTAHDKEGGHAFETHLHCKPTLKNPEDLLAIQHLVLSGNKHVFFGSDSAPHPQDVKECAHCASGVFSSPIAIQTVTSWFMNQKTHDWWQEETGEDLQRDTLRNRLEAFMGSN